MSYFKIARGWEGGYLSLIRVRPHPRSVSCLTSCRADACSQAYSGQQPGPFWERRLGLSRSALLAIWSAGIPMAPVMIMFFMPNNRTGTPYWQTAVMLTGELGLGFVPS